MSVHAAITRQPIDVDELVARVCSSHDGAVATFTGVVRDHSDGAPVLRLDYEAYEPMALLELERIATVVAARHALGGVALVHRVGSLSVGEVSVAVVAASEHRAPALAACAEAIELVKRDVPVWKREHRPDGARWVDARFVVSETVDAGRHAATADAR
jgi:molybdopterin synthase catalytic subunit